MKIKKLISLLVAAIMAVGLLPLCVLSETAKDDPIPITEINILGFRPPVIGSTPEYSYFLSVEPGQGYLIVYQYWHDNTLNQDMFVEQDPFVARHYYSTGCLICPEDGYYIPDDCVFKFNGSAELSDPELCFHHQYFSGSWYVHSAAVRSLPSTPIYGDSDGDGSIDTEDALKVLRAALDLGELTIEEHIRSDVDWSGEADTGDALLIFRYAMGIISEFPAN